VPLAIRTVRTARARTPSVPMNVVVTTARSERVRSTRRAADDRVHDTVTAPAPATRVVDEHT
jgi:hypothetical protein